MRLQTLITFLAVTLIVLLLSTVTIATAIVAWGEMVTLDLALGPEDGQTRILLPAPAFLLDALLGVSLSRGGAERLDLWPEELVDWSECIQQLAAELELAPSGVYIEIQTPEESILVRKRGRRLHFEVDAPEARVRVRVPVRLLRRTVDRLAPP